MSAPIIHFEVNLRPLRIAFLVRPDDSEAMLRIFQYNTAVWGGIYNALVPALKRRPQWWGKYWSKVSAQYIVDQYLSLLEPDIIVIMNGVDGIRLNFRPEDTVKENDFFECKDRRDFPKYGTGSFDIYSYLYRKTFRFSLKNKPDIILPSSSEELPRLFVAGCFGDFPDHEALSFIKEAYTDAFDPSHINIGQQEVAKYQTISTSTPLNIGSLDIECEPKGWKSDPILFLCNPDAPKDIMDFWNLRALGFNVRAVPISSRGKTLEIWRGFITNNHPPYRDSKKIYHRTTVMPSRSLTEAHAESFISALGERSKELVSLQSWYPPIWDHRSRSYNHVSLPSLSAQQRREDVPLGEGRRVSFRSLAPDFAERYSGGNEDRWANVARYTDYRWESDLAKVLPPNLEDSSRFLSAGTLSGVSVSSEGLVLRSRFKEMSHHIELPENLGLFHPLANLIIRDTHPAYS